MELLDLVDENNNLTGEKCDRKQVHEKGLWHREIAVFIINSNKELLIQKRSPNKKLAANMWALTAGHIDAGEKEVEAALRETQEELGIEDIKQDDFKLLTVKKSNGCYGDIINNHFKNIFLLKINKNIDEFVIQESEVSEVKYISIDELKNDIINNKSKYELDYTKVFFQEYFKEIITNIENNNI